MILTRTENKALVVPRGASWNTIGQFIDAMLAATVVDSGQDPAGFTANSTLTEVVLRIPMPKLPQGVEKLGYVTVIASNGTFVVLGKLTGPGQSGGSGAGLPAGYTFEEFTICDSGSPATRWWPTWTSDPE